MSLFEKITLKCPGCGEPVEFEAVASVNADRRPDLRQAILDASFQCQTCSRCQQTFRLDPRFTYIHLQLGQWLIVHPLSDLGRWPELEQQGRATFEKAYGAQAPALVRRLSSGIQPRITFGWAGLREKLVVRENELDDVTLELTKSLLVRGLNPPPLASGTELRLRALEGDQLIFAWIHGPLEKAIETLSVPRSLYDQITADPEGWKPLRDELSAGLYVDLNKLILAISSVA